MKKFLLRALAATSVLVTTLSCSCEGEADEIVILHASMEVKPEYIESFKEISRELVNSTRQEEGCISYTLLQDAHNPTKFTFYEEYTSVEAVKFHSAQPYLAKFREQRAPMTVAGSSKVLRYKAKDVEI